jgi:ribosomal protein S18 acetylase RimI-like enzyme
MADILIRPMVESDLLAYKALRDAMLTGHPEAFTSDAETEGRRDLASYRNRLAGGANGSTLFTLVALDGSRLVGALTCEREPRRNVQHLAHLIGMMVADTHAGRGIGRALLTLSVTASNRTAIGLYQSQGFERYGSLPDAIRLPDGRHLAKDLMRLTLA